MKRFGFAKDEFGWIVQTPWGTFGYMYDVTIGKKHWFAHKGEQFLYYKGMRYLS